MKYRTQFLVWQRYNPSNFTSIKKQLKQMGEKLKTKGTEMKRKKNSFPFFSSKENQQIT